LDLIKVILDINANITRRFQIDYLIFDMLFMILWIGLLLRHKRQEALYVGVICGLFFYAIDGIIWTAMGVREYELPAAWLKFPVDFMMDVSYGILGFGWAWLAFERRSTRDVAFWTAVLFGGWLIVPFLSSWAPLIDARVVTVRHMASRVWLHIAVVVIGYAALLSLGYSLGRLIYVFWVGCMLAFMMEFSLLVAGIRSFDLKLLVYETLILTNMGIPYLYIIRDRILPSLSGEAAACKAVSKRADGR
jgi:hypothetical protein